MTRQSSKKQAVIESSIEAFIQKGYEATSMDFIAQHAQVSKRTLYKYFANKRDLLNAIIVYLIENGQRSLSFTFDSKLDLKTQLTQIIAAKVQIMLLPTNLKLAKLIIGQYFCDSKTDQDIYDQSKILELLRNEKTTINWLKKAQKAQLLDKQTPPEKMLEILRSLINGLIFFPILFEEKKQCSEQDKNMVCESFLTLFMSKKK